MMGRLIRFLLGSVTVEVRGADVERLLTQCARRGVAFRDVRRLEADRVRLTVGLDGYFTLRALSRRAMCRLRTVGKRGVPFTARRLEKRWGLLLGAALAVAAAWYLSGFVWTIGLDGESGLDAPQLLVMLDRAGLRTGTRLAKVDAQDIRNQVMLMTDELSFFAVNLRGTHAQVTVRGREESMPRVDQDTPCDIVSDKAGVIVALRVREGLAQVKVGQTLAVGDTIAVGTLTSTQGLVWQVHASAEADLRVWYTLERRLPTEAYRVTETGEVIERRALALGNVRIPLYLIETEPFPWYDKKVEKNALSLGADFRLPLMLIKESYFQLEGEPAAVDSARAAQVLEAGLREELAIRHPDARVQSASFEMTEQAGVFVGRLRAECIETAGIEKEVRQ